MSKIGWSYKFPERSQNYLCSSKIGKIYLKFFESARRDESNGIKKFIFELGGNSEFFPKIFYFKISCLSMKS
jgi:hypothetical protein